MSTQGVAVSARLRPKVLLIDDEAALLELLVEWFACFDYEVATAKDGAEAIALMQDRRFDVIVTDLKLPGLSGLHLLSIFKEQDPAVEVIFLSGEGTMEDAIEALREGKAFDFLQKPLKNLRLLNQAIDKAYGRRQARLAPAEHPPAPQPAASRLGKLLTARELEIIGLLMRGLENREIAERLHITEKTTKNHLTRIYEKLKVKNRTQALLLCQQAGLTPDEG